MEGQCCGNCELFLVSKGLCLGKDRKVQPNNFCVDHEPREEEKTPLAAKKPEPEIETQDELQNEDEHKEPVEMIKKTKKKVLSTTEAAEYLNLSPNYIRDLVALQEIPYSNISRGEKACYRFDPKELDKWLKKQPGIKASQLPDNTTKIKPKSEVEAFTPELAEELVKLVVDEGVATANDDLVFIRDLVEGAEKVVIHRKTITVTVEFNNAKE